MVAFLLDFSAQKIPDLLKKLCGQAALHGFFHPAGPELHLFDTGDDCCGFQWRISIGT